MVQISNGKRGKFEEVRGLSATNPWKQGGTVRISNDEWRNFEVKPGCRQERHAYDRQPGLRTFHKLGETKCAFLIHGVTISR